MSTTPDKFLEFIREIKSFIHQNPDKIGQPIYYKIKTHKTESSLTVNSPNKKLISILADEFKSLEKIKEVSDENTGQIFWQVSLDYKIYKLFL